MRRFADLTEKKAYRKLKKLQWRILQLHQIRLQDDDCVFDRAEDINAQIADLQQEVDGLLRKIK